jgi:hypothetical protein
MNNLSVGTEPIIVSPKGKYLTVVSIWLLEESVIRDVLERLSWWM